MREITKIKVTYHKKDKSYVTDVLEASKHIIKNQRTYRNKFAFWKYTVIIEVEQNKFSRENLALILSRLDYACEKGKKVEYFKN